MAAYPLMIRKKNKKILLLSKIGDQDLDFTSKGLCAEIGWIKWGTLLLLGLLGGCMDGERRTLSPMRATSRPYVIKNQCYTPQPHYELTETGIASHYGGLDGCHGSLTATGERFDMFQLTAAHKTLPLPCVILVENMENGKKIILKVNDRGPFVAGRILDVSIEAARRLGFYEQGTAPVCLTTLVDQSVEEAKKPFLRSQITMSLEEKIAKTIFLERKRMAMSQGRIGIQIQAPKKPLKSINSERLASKGVGRKIYLSVRVSSLGQALHVEEQMRAYGKTDLRKTTQGLAVLVGPFPSLALAKNCCAAIPFPVRLWQE